MANELNIRNPKARFDYHIERSLEAGIVLLGSEVKAIRDGKIRLLDAYVEFENQEAWLKQLWIGQPENQTSFPHEESRKRKLLLSRSQINQLIKEVERHSGATVVPLRVYQSDSGKLKVEVGLALGKTKVDKKRVIQEREAKRSLERIKKGARE